MAKIKINGKELEVDPGKNLLETILSAGFDVPYFCWHPKLGSVGACRQCAVVKYKDENDKVGRIVMSCMEAATEGSIISTDAPMAKEFRANVIEALMTNHPHDCPVCDEGGECHLQDMTVMSGHKTRKFAFPKRTHNNQYLGPFINHEMNRCIQCYRCVRYYRDFAGGDDLNVFSSRNRVYFGRATEGTLESEFSGNLVEICPTGVFTDKTFMEHPARKWDLTTAPSVCAHCSVGCNTIAGERYGTVRRIYSRYNEKVNGYFLCDRGRFGYEYTNSAKRIKSFVVPGIESATSDIALSYLANLLKGKKLAGIGSARASLETNFVLKQIVGADNFSVGLNIDDLQLAELSLDIMSKGAVKVASLNEIEKSEGVIVLGEDVTHTAPMIALAIRQAIKNVTLSKASKAGISLWNDAPVREIVQGSHGPIYVAASAATRLDDVSNKTYIAVPQEIARFGYAVAHFVDSKLKLPNGLSAETTATAERAAKDLLSVEKPLVVSGVHAKSREIIQSAYTLALALKNAGKEVKISLTFEESNTAGVVMLGGRALETLPDADVLLVVENDLFRKLSKKNAEALLARFKTLVVLDHISTHTSKVAQVIVPVGSFAEADGTLVSQEGRAQRFYQVFVPEADTPEPWRRLVQLSGLTDNVLKFNSLHDITSLISSTISVFKEIDGIAPPPDFRINGQKIARESHRYSGRTSMKANINVHELRPVEDNDSPMSFTMEGYQGETPASLTTHYWSPGWNSVQSINKYQIEVGGALHGGDPGQRLTDKSEGSLDYYHQIPEAWIAPKDGLSAVPVYQIFGSEELSRKSPSVKERSEKAFILLHPADAETHNLIAGEVAEVTLDDQPISLIVKTANEIIQGTACFSMGYCNVNPEAKVVYLKK